MELDQQFSDLMGTIYEGAFESYPWESFLSLLRQIMSAANTTLVLRPPSEKGAGVLLTDGGLSQGIAAYNDYMYTQDPFVDLPPGEVRSLDDFISEEDLVKSKLYQVCMKPAGLYYSLGADLVVPGVMEARLRITRAKQSQRFMEKDKTLIKIILPHLQRAIQTHARLNKIESELAMYSGAMEQLAVGSIILDENGRILNCNNMAHQLLATSDGLVKVRNKLHLNSRELSRELQTKITSVLKNQHGQSEGFVQAMRVQRPSGLSDLGLLIKPVPDRQWSEGKAVPSVVIFISDPEMDSNVPAQVIAHLFGFTPAEATLAMLLVNGLTLDDVTQELNITRNTARTHLRAIFNKTGVGRQSMLVRLILKSVAPLAGT